MKSDLPKVLHPVAGEPMVRWVVDACREVGASPTVLVVGHGADQVRGAFDDDDAALKFALQEPQLGTGHAVMQARDALGAAGDLDVLVLAGDGPLIRAKTLQTLIDTHRRAGAAATLATATLDDPTGYGRIVRDASGAFERIVEERDATPEQRAICEINPSYYIFRADDLFDALDRIDNNNAKGEYYLTDVFEALRSVSGGIEVVAAVPAEDVLSINTPEQLEQVSRILEARLASHAETAPPRRTTA